MMARIIVTDGNSRSALAAVRSLGRAGHEVIVAGPAERTLAGSSRYASRVVVLPDPQEAPLQYTSEVSRIAKLVNADLILPVTDPSMSALLGAGELPASIRIMGPSRDAYQALANKQGLMALGRAAGLTVPKTAVANTPDDLVGAATEVGFPCVLKPYRSVVSESNVMRTVRVSYARDLDEIRASLQRYPVAAFPMLVQERIIGPGEGVFLLVHRGEILAAFAHRRIREYPVSGGASTYRESIDVPAELRERCRRLLASVDWSGAAMVEFTRSQDTGESYLMEVNGRLWGSLKLAIDAGVDFPAMLARLALGEPVPPVEGYRTGIRCRWFWGDVDHLIDRLVSSREKLDLPPGAPSRLRAIFDFLVWRPDLDRFEIMSPSDPNPWFYETSRWFDQRFRRLRKRFKGAS
jgi:predicted ATP-grasp superfamily ATP-dependent carboligase